MEEVIRKFKNKKVLVVGDAMLDKYIKGISEKLCREAPAPVINVLQEEYNCGGAANTAINISNLGAETFFISVIGKDEAGKKICNLLKKNKVNVKFLLTDTERSTLIKNRITASSNILLRVDSGSEHPLNSISEGQLIQNIEKLINKIDAIVLSDYAYGIFSSSVIEKIHNIIKDKNKVLVIDSRDLSKFRKLKPTAVKPNYEESISLLKFPKLKGAGRVNQIISSYKSLLTITGAQFVNATIDKEGTVLIEKGKHPIHLETISRENKNSIGAGDTYIGALTLSLSCGCSGKKAAEIASAAASIVLQKEGTEFCTMDLLINHFRKSGKFISTKKELLSVIEALNHSGKKVVFTNGCFDLLHRGHISLLKKARELGDVLIVGLNTDESIRKVKGEDRPINTLSDRIAVLEELECVDLMVSFSGEELHQLLKIIRPQYFVKGGNYSYETIPEAKLIEHMKGTVKIIPITFNTSTSSLIEKIRNRDKHTVKIKIKKKKYESAGR
ncbi:MAG: PfkB family carbohydrate kinase [Cytophagaceae bacterium]